jgi:phosphoesterase RecJ-like protein
MLKQQQKKLFAQVLKTNNKFLVSGHQGPDGDVIGSTIAMVLGLKKLGKKARAFNHDGCPTSLKFLPKSELFVDQIPKGFEDAVLITVDSGDLNRLGSKIVNHGFKEIWNIDHHKSNTRFGTQNFVDIKAGSTGQVVLELLSACRGFKLTKDIAENIFCTLSTDTGSFRYSNSTPELFELASKLVKAGARPEVVSEALYETYPRRRLVLLKEVLGSLKFENNGTIAKLFLTNADLEKAQAESGDSEEFVNLPRGIVGVKIVCFIKEKTSTEWKLSLRARGDVDVLKVAKAFGGGGHKLAAGATMFGTRLEIESKLDAELKKQGYL